MALNDFTTTVLDGGLGVGQINTDALIIAVGVSGSGTANTITSLLKKADTVKSTLTSGPLMEYGCYHIVKSKQPLYCLPVNASVAGTGTSITKSNGSSPTITKSGTPKDSYSMIFEIVEGGDITSGASEGTYRYSTDGGDTYSAEIAIPTASADSAATTTGTTDTTTGGLYGGGGTLNSKVFTINVDGGGVDTITFSSPANAAAVVTAINTAVGATVASIVADRLKLTSPTTGASSSLVIAAGSPDALAVLGITAGTYTGADGVASITLGATGQTLSLPQGTYTGGDTPDTFTWATSEPSYVLNDLNAAMDAIVAATTLQYFLVHVIGAASSSANALAIAEALETYAEDLAALHKFCWIVMSAPKASVATAAQLRASFEDFAADTDNKRVSVVYPYCELESEATKNNGRRQVFERSGAWPFVARLASIPISESAAWVGRGSLAGVKLVAATYLDEADAMDDAGFVTLREHVGKAGYYLNQARIMAPVGSDYLYGEYRRLMDVACNVARERGVNYLNGKILVNAATGLITEAGARAVEDDIGGALRAKLVDQDAADAIAVVDRTINVLSEQRMAITTKVTPHSYGRTISHEISLQNPAATG